MIRVFACWIFFFKTTAPTKIYTLALRDALPIGLTRFEGWRLCGRDRQSVRDRPDRHRRDRQRPRPRPARRAELCPDRSEEHTSELQSSQYIVCRLLLEKKNQNSNNSNHALANIC